MWGKSSNGLAHLLTVLVILLLFIRSPKKKALRMRNPIAYKVYDLLLKAGFVPDTAKYITAQSAFETGNFSSVIFKEQNNLFGMKLPKIRKTVADGEARGHAVYNSVEDSVTDYRLYWNNFKHPEIFADLQGFTSLLKAAKYFEANIQHYTKGTEFYYKMYFNE
jgi:hypothetical protein